MNQMKNHPALAGPGMMILSAVIFGYFGFTSSWNYYSITNGQFLLYVAILDWTLKGAGVGFATAAIVTFAHHLLGNIIYSVVGLITAVLFLIVAVWDQIDTQNSSFYLPYLPGPVVLFLFAAWNGYGSWFGMRAVLELMRPRPGITGGPGSETRGEG